MTERHRTGVEAGRLADCLAWILKLPWETCFPAMLNPTTAAKLVEAHSYRLVWLDADKVKGFPADGLCVAVDSDGHAAVYSEGVIVFTPDGRGADETILTDIIILIKRIADPGTPEEFQVERTRMADRAKEV